MRTNLVARYGRVADKETGEDKSQELLESPQMKGVRKPRPMIDVAKTAGLEKLYRQVYGAMPMEVHSNTFGIEKEEDLDEKRFA